MDLTRVDAQDAADAEALLGQLMQVKAGTEGAPGDSGEATAKTKAQRFYEEVSGLLRDFNVSISDESKDRKYRFHIKRLMKSHERQVEHCSSLPVAKIALRLNELTTFGPKNHQPSINPISPPMICGRAMRWMRSWIITMMTTM